jgi:uncharacterized protein with PIN domain
MERFAADRMLGKLAKWLRVLGYDVVYLRRADKEDILGQFKQGRILLTRDRRARLWRNQGNVFVVQANDPKKQLREVVQGLGLSRRDSALFSRCLFCNQLLTPVSRKEVREEVPEYVYQTQDQFHRCHHCGKVYWPGSHPQRMRQHLDEIFKGED